MNAGVDHNSLFFEAWCLIWSKFNHFGLHSVGKKTKQKNKQQSPILILSSLSHHPWCPPRLTIRQVCVCSLQLWLLLPPSSPLFLLRASSSGQTGSYGTLSWGLLLQHHQLCVLLTNCSTSFFQTFTSTRMYPASAARPDLPPPCYKFA